MPHTKDDDKKKQDNNAKLHMKNVQRGKNTERGERQYSKKTDHL
ncbi:DUF3941 domain-containing protein [Anaerobacillus alkalilacustris]|nr:DUF3941 domain-containing protein [Anaerobacillus alkalilacustris]